MPIRVNGGVFNNQMLTGSLTHYVVCGADFSGAINSFGQPVPLSAAEIIFTNIEASAYVNIMNPNSCNLSFALESDRSTWNAVTLEIMIRGLGTDVGVDHIDCSVCTVEQVPYIWQCGPTTATSFLGLSDTPDTYAGSANWSVVVNPTADGLIFVPSTTTNTDYIPIAPGTSTPAGYKYFVTSAGTVNLPPATGILLAGASVTIAKPAGTPQVTVFVNIDAAPDIIVTQLGNTDSIEMDAAQETIFVFDGINSWHLQIGSVN